MEKYRRIRSFLVSCARIDLLGRTNRPVQSAASKTECFVQVVGSQIRAMAPGGDRGGVGGGSCVYVRYGTAEQQGTGVGTRVYLRVYEAGK